MANFKMWITYTEAVDPLQLLNQESWFTFARSSGPGGQNVNKTSSKAVLWWDVGHSKIWNGDIDAMTRFGQMFKNQINKQGLLVLSSQEHRDQPTNKLACMDKLKMMVQQALVPPVERVISQPTSGSQERRIADKMADKRTRERRNYTPDFD